MSPAMLMLHELMGLQEYGQLLSQGICRMPIRKRRTQTYPTTALQGHVFFSDFGHAQKQQPNRHLVPMLYPSYMSSVMSRLPQVFAYPARASSAVHQLHRSSLSHTSQPVCIPVITIPSHNYTSSACIPEITVRLIRPPLPHVFRS